MLSFPHEIHFWSTQEDILIKPNDFRSNKYYSKKDYTEYAECKRLYLEKKGLKTRIINKRPEKLKDKLQELEEALLQYRIVYCLWKDNELKILLSRGLIAHIKLNPNGYPTSINLDKTLALKIQSEIISDGVITDNQVVCVCKDGKVVGYGSATAKEWMLEICSKKYISLHNEWLVLWGKTELDHPQPWSPIAKEHQRANLHLYWIGTRGPDLLSFKRTDGEPIKVIISKRTPRSIIVVEQKISQRGAVSVEVCLLELIGNALKRVMVTLVPLQTQVCCSALSHKENYLVLGCIDGTVALLDRNKGSTKVFKLPFIPSHVAWHESEALMIVANEKGQLQCYDIALNCIAMQLNLDDYAQNVFLDISSYFSLTQVHRSIDHVFWGPTDILIAMNQGPLVTIKLISKSLSFLALTQMYLNSDKCEKAIALLLNWDFDENAFIALQRIINHILREPLNENTSKLLQSALGCFHCPPIPLSSQTKHRYGAQVKCLTRRFFHQLVRTKMFETAFLLAVDLGHHDLFMDLYHIAVKIGETEMAAAARAQASSLLSRCSSDASNCSRTSCSQCSDSSSSESHLEEPESVGKQRVGDQRVGDRIPERRISEARISEHRINEQRIGEVRIEQKQHGEHKMEEQRIGDQRMGSSSSDYLSTNFNNPIPKTYKPASALINPVIDLPKIRLPHKPTPIPPLPISCYNSIGIPLLPPAVHPRITPTLPPRVPFISSSIPSVPRPSNANINESRFVPITPLRTVPLLFPCTLSSPNTFTNSNVLSNPNSLPNPNALPNSNSLSNVNTLSNPNTLLNSISHSNPNILLNSNSPSNLNTLSNPNTSTSAPLASSNLPVSTSSTPLSIPSTSANANSNTVNVTNAAAKKPQAKVKFSDTVTAFIVPEVKRPQRLAPPAHVTDPQKELADSLPLCHPNEDYLKDFAPIQREQSENSPAQPKITVVHFGVV